MFLLPCADQLCDDVTLCCRLWPFEDLIYYSGPVFTSGVDLSLRGKHNSPYGCNVKSGLFPFKLWASDA